MVFWIFPTFSKPLIDRDTLRNALLVLLVFTCVSCMEEADPAADQRTDEDRYTAKRALLQAEVSKLETRKDSLERQIIGLDSLLFDNEDFHPFLMQFVHDSTFTDSRIEWPLLLRTGGPDLNKPLKIDSQHLDRQKWLSYHRLLDGQDVTNTDIYDNFALKGNPTNERVLHKYAVEQCGDIKYYFEGFDGEWRLVRIDHFGT